jgi:hypothetical protein
VPMSVQDRTRKAAAASSRAARVRRFQRYLREMRATGLLVKVVRKDAVTWEDDRLPEFNADPLAFPEVPEH